MTARAAWLLLVLLAAGNTASLASDKKIDGVDEGTFRFGSMAIGQAKDLDYARAEGLGLVPKSPLDAYLNGILAKLLAQSPVKGVPARVYVRASGDWAAKTTADANIYVSLGTLLRLDNEDEVAALLAHETSHVVLGHADADIVTGVQQRALQLSSLALDAKDAIQGGGAAKAGTAAKASGESARVEEQSQALLLNTMIIVPAWTRGQERDADLLGIDLLVRAGYSPQAMASLLRKQQKVETERAADGQVKALDKLVGTDATAEVENQAQHAARNLGVNDDLGKLAGGAIGKVFEWGAKKVDNVQRAHPKTEERISDAEVYVKREYADASGRTVQVETWEAAKDQDGTADVLENYIAAIEAKAKLGDGDLTAARKLSKSSLSGPTRADAYPNYVDAAVQKAQGNAASALTAYETALGGPEPAGAIYTEASAVYLQTGKRDKAAEVIEAGYKRLQEPPSLTVPLIHTYRALGRQADADRVATECAARWPKMQSLCVDEAKGM